LPNLHVTSRKLVGSQQNGEVKEIEKLDFCLPGF